MTSAELVLSSRERNVRLSLQHGLLKSLSHVRARKTVPISLESSEVTP